MDEVLASLLAIPGVQTALVVGKDGLVITSAGQSEDPDSIGVSAADMLSALESSLPERAPFTMVTLESAQGTLCACAINEVTYLMVVGTESLNLGRVRLELKSGARSLVDQL